MKYLLIEEATNDSFVQEFNTEIEALTQGEIDWQRMTDGDKKSRKAFYVLESINPDEEAENHYDGNILKKWK